MTSHDSVMNMQFSDKIPVFEQATYPPSHDSKNAPNFYHRIDSLIPSEHLATQLPEVVFCPHDHLPSLVEYDNPPPEVVQHPRPDRHIQFGRESREAEDGLSDGSEIWGDSDLEDLELFGPEAIARRTRQSESKALQLLGLQETVRKPSLRRTPVRETRPSPPSSVTHARKAIRLLGLDSPQCDRASISSSQITEDDGMDAVSELPGDATDTQEIPGEGGPLQYHDAIRTLQNAVDSNLAWTKQQADVAIAVGVVGSTVGVSTMATGVFNAAQSKRSADASTRSARAAELSAETAVAKLMLDASQPPRVDNLQQPQSNGLLSPPMEDPQSRFSPDSDIEFRLPSPPRSPRPRAPQSPRRQFKNGVEQSLQNVKKLQQQFASQAAQKNDLERRRQNIESVKNNLRYSGNRKHSVGDAAAIVDQRLLDKQLRLQRQRFSDSGAYTYTSRVTPAHSRNSSQVSNSASRANDYQSPPHGYAVNATPRRGLKKPHVAAMMAPRTSSEVGTDVSEPSLTDDGTKMIRLGVQGRGSLDDGMR